VYIVHEMLPFLSTVIEMRASKPVCGLPLNPILSGWFQSRWRACISPKFEAAPSDF
jgi:hypothetical protein